MLVENQLIEVIWSARNKQWYLDKGYTFSGLNNPFLIKIEDLPIGSTKQIECICDYCGKRIKTSYKNYLERTKNNTIKYACYHCKGKKFSEYRTEEERNKSFSFFLEYCDEMGYTPISTVKDYTNSKTKLKYICPIHGERETDYNRIKLKCKCSKCAKMIAANKRKLSKDKVISIVESKNNNKILNPDDYKRQKDANLKIKCGSCGQIFITSLASIIGGDGRCSKCKAMRIGFLNANTDEYVNGIIKSKNNNLWINKGEYINSNTSNLKIKCGSCGRIYTISLNNYQRNKTGKCSDCNGKSQGETIISLILDSYKVIYNRQKIFNDCVDKTYLPFDFYLPDYNLCIEFDGQHHYNPVWGEVHLANTLRHDNIKNAYCQQNGIDLLRIPYWERDNIEKILIEKLNLKLKEESA